MTIKVRAYTETSCFTGRASTIRGVRQVLRRYMPAASRVVLRGTADELNRANGQSLTWQKTLDLVTHWCPIEYEIVRGAAP